MTTKSALEKNIFPLDLSSQSFVEPKRVAMILLGSWALALFAQLTIYLPFSPVPITGQTLGVLLVGALLGARGGAYSVMTYLLQGALGFPFFAGAAGGVAHLLGPTGGYLVGFIFAAAAVGWFFEQNKVNGVFKMALVFTVGQSIVFTLGLVVLSFWTGWSKVLTMGLIPFIPGAIVKVIFAVLMVSSVLKLNKKERTKNV